MGISVATVIGFVAAADTSSSFFMLIALPYFAVFCHILLSSAVDTGRSFFCGLPA